MVGNQVRPLYVQHDWLAVWSELVRAVPWNGGWGHQKNRMLQVVVIAWFRRVGRLLLFSQIFWDEEAAEKSKEGAMTIEVESETQIQSQDAQENQDELDSDCLSDPPDLDLALYDEL